MGLFRTKQPAALDSGAVTVQTSAHQSHPFQDLGGYTPLGTQQNRLYRCLREAVPVLDTAIYKIIRLTGGFSVTTGGDALDRELTDFLEHVNVGGNQVGIESFVATYLDQLLTFGTAVGETVVGEGRITGLYNADLQYLEVRQEPDTLGLDFYVRNGLELQPVARPQLIHYSVLNPEPGQLLGTSLLKGLPFVCDILMKIYHTIGANWERLGNVRFALTYKPQNDSGDRAFAKERASHIAKQWSEAMQPGGSVKDFVTVGDVSIKVIGADNQILDSNVPVRQMLEQIVAKTGIPPFMLGLSWSSTERMSSQQADVLTSELEAYRRILTPVIRRIAETWLQFQGKWTRTEVVWNDITLQDEVELSKARLHHAQAAQIEKELEA
ncbi:MAG: phage portal protein [Clostridiales bacterium]|nr:phage portal protein [Clostridiales bacterium]